MTPFPPFWVGFHCGGLGRYSLCGVNGFVLGVVVTVGYRPTGSSDVGKPPSGGTTPSTKHPNKTEAYNLTHKTPRSGVTPL